MKFRRDLCFPTFSGCCFVVTMRHCAQQLTFKLPWQRSWINAITDVAAFAYCSTNHLLAVITRIPQTKGATGSNDQLELWSFNTIPVRLATFPICYEALSKIDGTEATTLVERWCGSLLWSNCGNFIVAVYSYKKYLTAPANFHLGSDILVWSLEQETLLQVKRCCKFDLSLLFFCLILFLNDVHSDVNSIYQQSTHCQ